MHLFFLVPSDGASAATLQTGEKFLKGDGGGVTLSKYTIYTHV